jgi:hypothetical protein
MMVRDTVVSTCDTLDPVFQRDPSTFWRHLTLRHDPVAPFYVVVNEACIQVTEKCFRGIDLLHLKRTFGTIECYEQRNNFIVIRFKMGLVMKPLRDIWVTPNDEMYWANRLWGYVDRSRIVEKFGYPYITSYIVDLNPFFQHNAFPKNILAFNALKNAVLATDPRYVRYFMDTVSAYVPEPTALHQVVLAPEDDGISKYFVLRVPRVVVAYASFKGCTQEDGIVQKASVRAFDCCRFYSLRFKIVTAGKWIKFHHVRGDPDDTDFVGTVVGDADLQIEPFSLHVRIVSKSPREHDVHFTKPPFRVLDHFVTDTKWLTVCLEQEHRSSTGDKLCTFHGQKGVIRVMDEMCTLDETVQPDLVVNPYSLFRMTAGQILEGLHEGGGRDARTVRNSDGDIVPGARAYYASTFYFPIAYWSSEHLYAPENCKLDKVLGQAVKGRSRGGGMRLGNMELFNALRGNGLASCFERKFFEDGDRVPDDKIPTLAIPKSVNLVQEDARFYKANFEYEAVPSVERIEKK